MTTAGGTDVIYTPTTTLATLAAKRSWLGRVYLDWSLYPVVEQTGIDADGVATVRFRDLRFGYDTFLTHAASGDKAGEQFPLTGDGAVDGERRVAGDRDEDGRTRAAIVRFAGLAHRTAGTAD